MSTTKSTNIIPTLRYKKTLEALDWLEDVFGFTKHLVVPGANGTVRHAQLTLDNSMIMVGSPQDDDYGRLIKQPREAGGSTQGLYVIVNDPDAHCARAKKGGAEIMLDIDDQPQGGRAYTARDIEGHVWTFGDYDPFV